MQLCKKTAALIFCLLMISFEAVQAIESDFINYQGRLTDSYGTPQTGTFDMTFRLFPTDIGGSVLWQEMVSDVQVTDGLFSHLLGSGTGGEIPDSLFNLNALWLEIEVEGEIIGTRSPFTAVAVSKRVASIDGATAGNLSGTLVITPEPAKVLGDAIQIVNSDGAVVFSASVNSSGTTEISMFDPVDSKDGRDLPSVPRVEITTEGIIMFDTTGNDTTMGLTSGGELMVSGDIIGAASWTSFPFASGFENYQDAHGGGYQRVEYRKIGDIVYLRGLVHSADHSPIHDGSLFGTLPEGFRPPATVRFETAPTTSSVLINSSGEVRTVHASTPDSQFLDGIFFSTTPSSTTPGSIVGGQGIQ